MSTISSSSAGLPSTLEPPGARAAAPGSNFWVSTFGPAEEAGR